ncbi:MAG TPA: spore coat protein CotJB [Paenibacillus sp.]|jgi:spore coat protein JB
MEPRVCDKQYYEWLEQIQVLDFALIELNLYLDTHPNDLKSIEQFNQIAQERKKLAKQFQEVYGPLQNFGNSFSKYPWEWSQGPWPWQV